MKENQQTAADGKTAVEAGAGQNPPWKAKTVWIAVLLVILGCYFWVKDAASTPTPRADTPGKTGFAADSPGNGKSPAVSGKPQSPATFRLGVSYLGGFFLGWGLRRFLKLTLLLSGALIILIAMGKKLGWVDLDWAAVEAHVRSSSSWLSGEAASLKTFFTGYLPSAGAAGIGAFFGFRRK